MKQNYLPYLVLQYLNSIITYLKQYSFSKILNIKISALLLLLMPALQSNVFVQTAQNVTIPFNITIYNAPRWTMDLKNGSIATAFLPMRVYRRQLMEELLWKTPAHLDCCDDIFVMPHTY